MSKTERELHRLRWRLDYVVSLLHELRRKESALMLNLDELKAQVERNVVVEQSALTLIQGIAQALRDAAADPAQVHALANQLENSAASLADAVSANTPAAP